MGVRRTLRRVALSAERTLDGLLTFKRRRRPPLIEPYTGYATPRTLVARGRILTHLRRHSPNPQQGWFTNLMQMAALFLTDEVSGVAVSARDGAARAVSDEEGYFTLVLPRDGEGASGWTEVEARIEGSNERAALPVLVPGAEARIGVISDVDDTVMHTGAYSLARNLWTSLTGNALTRQVFPDSVALLRALSEGGRNPVFYVSSSPWNLHRFLEAVFDRRGVVPGPMFLRDLGLNEEKTEGPHGGHKGAAIDVLMAANPDLPFWLLGDTGQHDAEVYLDVARRHPGRVARVALREPGPGPDAGARAAMGVLRALGVEVTSARDFWGAVPEVVADGRPSADPGPRDGAPGEIALEDVAPNGSSRGPEAGSGRGGPKNGGSGNGDPGNGGFGGDGAAADGRAPAERPRAPAPEPRR